MVSLFDLRRQQTKWDTLSTGLPSLDQTLRYQKGNIIDIQTVPSDYSAHALATNILASHLRRDENNRIVVIETFNDFTWDLFELHPDYCLLWDYKIEVIHLPTLAQVFSFFQLRDFSEYSPGSLITCITNFTETVEYYRLQISAAYEEELLRHQLDQARTLLANVDKVKEEGFDLVRLPQLPPNSDLLKVHPAKKAQMHIDQLFKLMSSMTFKFTALVILMGHMEPQWKANQDVLSTSVEASFTSSQADGKSAGKLVLSPVEYGKQHTGNATNLCDQKLLVRLLVYSDLYTNSSAYKIQRRPPEKLDIRIVSVVRLVSPSGSLTSNEPIFFEANVEKEQSGPLLSELQAEEEGGLSVLIQQSLSSTQMAPITQSTQIPTMPPSSPVKTKPPTQISAQDSDQVEKAATEDVFPDVIEASDTELTGTLLEDLVGSPCTLL